MRDEQRPVWTLEARSGEGAARVGGPLPAQVPGSVHVDLIAAGIIDDLTVRGRDDEQLWVAATPWRYRTTLRRPARPYERALLVFEGIDTVGRVFVGDELRLETADMFRRYELDVTADLEDGDDVTVTVELDPVLPPAQARETASPLPRPGEYWRPFNQVRKMACSFGWDWGPVTMSAGLWRPVRLETWTGARLADVRVAAVPADGATGGVVEVEVEVEGSAAAEVLVTVQGPDGEPDSLDARGTAPVTGGRARVSVAVPGARRWWPCTEGDQPLYDVTVALVSAGQGPLDGRALRVGFRTVEVEQRPDADGVSFALHVNGRKVWVRGLDWIPDDPFPARVTPQRYRDRLADAVAAGANAVRVWGGGLYEDDAFYDACDELGLLVIQDFLFACAAYPEDDATVADVRAEVADNVRRLRHRASLALWCGNNENLWGHEDWGWKEALGGRAWGLRYYDEILPELVAALDGTRPYVPGSPFSPDGAHPNDPGRGMTHIWDVWNERDYTDYERWRPRFVSEFGYQGPASWPTLVGALGTAPGAPTPDGGTPGDAVGTLDPADPALAHHQRAADGAAKLAAGLARHLPHPPTSGPAWYAATQLLQARAVTVGVTHLRSLHDLCGGAIWWQLNDLWPAISWSVVDVRGRRKLAWHALRAAFDARTVALTAGPSAVLVNDTAQAWTAALDLSAVRPDGVRVIERCQVTVPPHGAETVEVPVDGATLAVVADADGRRATRWLVSDLDPALTSALGPQAAGVEVRATGPDTLDVIVTASQVLRDAVLLAELAVPDAVVSGHPATLLPGERATFRVQLPPGDGPADVDWARLLWSDNRLRHPQDADGGQDGAGQDRASASRNSSAAASPGTGRLNQ